jgi:hypothetical protein
MIRRILLFKMRSGAARDECKWGALCFWSQHVFHKRQDCSTIPQLANQNFCSKRWGHDIPVSRDFWATRFLFLFECTSAKLMDLEMEQRYRPTFVKSEFLKGIICSWHLLPYRGAPTTLQDISVSSGDLQNLLIFNMCV